MTDDTKGSLEPAPLHLRISALRREAASRRRASVRLLVQTITIGRRAIVALEALEAAACVDAVLEGSAARLAASSTDNIRRALAGAIASNETLTSARKMERRALAAMVIAFPSRPAGRC